MQAAHFRFDIVGLDIEMQNREGQVLRFAILIKRQKARPDPRCFCIKTGGKTNFRVKNKATAEQLLSSSKGKIDNHPTYTDAPYKKGYEHHPNESHTINAPENDLPHIKWKDWSSGKKSGGAGHIFYE